MHNPSLFFTNILPKNKTQYVQQVILIRTCWKSSLITKTQGNNNTYIMEDFTMYEINKPERITIIFQGLLQPHMLPIFSFKKGSKVT